MIIVKDFFLEIGFFGEEKFNGLNKGKNRL